MKVLTDRRYAWLQAFLSALAISAVVFLPFVILDRGRFFYYGDFNVQQIPFYQLVQRSIKSGDVFWSWYTDLGANFIGSYSFYNLFSPFFWLTLPFPNGALPYLMAPLLALKTACASLTGFLYVSRFVRDARYAVLGGLLYAFSGYATYNIFFNHFHEVIVFFPLMLYALELLVVDGRRGVFALTVALNAMVNYWFFIGSVVFVVLYFLVRTISESWHITGRVFFAIAFESVLGVLVAGAALLPSVLAIMGNPRTTADNILTGWGFWLYGHEQRMPAIIESIFFPPDIPSRPNFFPDHGAKWASLSAWLPMIGPAFALGYIVSAPKSWLKRMLCMSLVIALVPGLNSIFVLFNNSYYARWFYMPVLLLALASVLALERYREGPKGVDLMRGMRYSALIVGVIILAVGLTPQEQDGKTVWGLEKYPARFWIYCAITVLGLACAFLLVYRFIGHPRFVRGFGISLACVCVVYSVTMVAMGRQHSDDRDWMRKIAIEGKAQLQLPSEEGRFDRADLYDTMDNLGMYWGLPNIQAFHSIVPVSIMEFYPSVGVKRDVSSKPQWEFYELRSLLSVRWLFVAQDEAEDKQPAVAHFRYYDNQLGFNIYENENYLPMGFGYENHITHNEFEHTDEEDRVRLLHKAVLVEEEDEDNVHKILDFLPYTVMDDFSEAAYRQDVENRRANSASAFYRDNRGFTSEITLPSEQIVFYSVPYDKGWSATVNGVPTKVLKVNNGFCGVPVPAGENVVRFDYLAPGLKLGAAATAAGVVLLLAYLLLCRRRPPLVPAGAGGAGWAEAFAEAVPPQEDGAGHLPPETRTDGAPPQEAGQEGTPRAWEADRAPGPEDGDGRA